MALTKPRAYQIYDIDSAVSEFGFENIEDGRAQKYSNFFLIQIEI